MAGTSVGAAQEETRNGNKYHVLFKSIDSGDLEGTKEFLDSHPEALTRQVMTKNDTPLHKAVLSGHVEIVEEIVRRIQDPKFLETKNGEDQTALTYAAMEGNVRIARCLVAKCPNLVNIPNKLGQVPVEVASRYAHKDLVRYLYSVTPLHDLYRSDGHDESKIYNKNGAMLLSNCIVHGLYDIALKLVERFPKLAYARDSDNDNDTPLFALAQKTSAFPSTTNLSSCKWWIYSRIHIDLDGVLNHDEKMKTRGDQTFRRKLLSCLNVLFPEVHKVKLEHAVAREILKRMSQNIGNEFEVVKQALFKAVENGIEEFLDEMMIHKPDIIWLRFRGCNIFLWAVRHRQMKIFRRIYRMEGKHRILANRWEKPACNNILHQAAFLAPDSWLHSSSGPALQMQKELQQFNEVENYVNPRLRKMVNTAKQTPRALFTEKHRKLREEGEKWMKDTAKAYSVIATLIATMIFAAAFSIPGGYDEHGKPINLDKKHKAFLVYMISNTVSLFTACVSFLMFLGILTAKYREEDFLFLLPTKLIVGLTSLFLSMATMMLAFMATLKMTLFFNDKHHHVPLWFSSAFMLSAVIPIGAFVLLQFRTLKEIFLSTYAVYFNKTWLS